jgi:2,3-bisphosphoglycerate-independent phosphoglycerate mutase
MPYDYLPPLLQPSEKKIVLLVLDGLGGLPIEAGGPTELEAAQTPHMNRLAAEGILGQVTPIRPGLTPGSGPAHLALFGYDPLEYEIGRGVLESVGVGMQVGLGDVAARGNFCTLDVDGNITDRRAGRISSEEALPLVELLKEIELPGVKTEVRHVKEYRFAVVLRGNNLNPDIDDTDPQRTGVPPLAATARSHAALHTAGLFNQWTSAARRVLSAHPKANGMTLRGFATDPNLPKFSQAYGLHPAAISVYPMYKGVASLVGMQVIDFAGETPQDEFSALRQSWSGFDFFFIHIKKTDSKGEDGDFDGKVNIIAGVDQALPALLDLNPDVLIITGDHSTPAKLRTHSWHPVPFLLWAPESARPDAQREFGERACAQGGLGNFSSMETLPLALAHSGRLEKYGA